MAAYRLTSTIVFGLLTFLAVSDSLRAQTQDDLEARFAALNWQKGPTQGDLGGMATIPVPTGHSFLGRGDASRFMELNQNPSDERELGVLLKDDASWFVVFEFSDDGYVDDEDRTLDAPAILDSIREGTQEANAIRRERGWPAMEVVGWQQPPFYDGRTNNLTWSIRGVSEGITSINHATRLLGRRGVMNLNLVVSSEHVGEAMPSFNSLVAGFSFNPGHRYAEFTRGDRVAEYGLTGLIVGGAGVALVKTGFLQKFWKLLVVAFIALAGGVRQLMAKLGRSQGTSEQRTDV